MWMTEGGRSLRRGRRGGRSACAGMWQRSLWTVEVRRGKHLVTVFAGNRR